MNLIFRIFALRTVSHLVSFKSRCSFRVYKSAGMCVLRSRTTNKISFFLSFLLSCSSLNTVHILVCELIEKKVIFVAALQCVVFPPSLSRPLVLQWVFISHILYRVYLHMTIRPCATKKYIRFGRIIKHKSVFHAFVSVCVCVEVWEWVSVWIKENNHVNKVENEVLDMKESVDESWNHFNCHTYNVYHCLDGVPMRIFFGLCFCVRASIDIYVLPFIREWAKTLNPAETKYSIFSLFHAVAGNFFARTSKASALKAGHSGFKNTKKDTVNMFMCLTYYITL